MDLIKRFIDCNVPTQVCNLKCEYCYVGQVEGFSGKIKPIEHSPAEVRAALNKKRMGGTIFINFCGTGETLLGDDILPIIQEVLKEGHYVQIVTNGTINKRFEEIAGWDRDLLDRLLIKFSYHYTELKRMGKLDDFFHNIICCRGAGCSISVEITSGDGMVPYIEEMKKACMDRLGALPHVTVARDSTGKELPLLTKYTKEEYANVWGGFHSELFDLKMELYGEKRCEYCYGGEWTFYLYLLNGDLKQCYKGEIIDNIFEDIARPIHFRPIGRECREPYCYNGHAWMTLGCIPSMDIPTYADMRNRVTDDGEEWLNRKAKEFFSHKLEENNIIHENKDSDSIGFLQGSAKKENNRVMDAADEKIRNDTGLLSQKRIVVYGAGDYGEKVYNELNAMGIRPYVFCDRSKGKQSHMVNGIPVVSPEEYRDEVCNVETDLLIIAIKDMQIVKSIVKDFSHIDGLNVCSYRIFPVIDEV